MLGLINRKSTINNNTKVTRSPIYFPINFPLLIDNLYNCWSWLQEKIKKNIKKTFLKVGRVVPLKSLPDQSPTHKKIVKFLDVLCPKNRPI